MAKFGTGSHSPLLFLECCFLSPDVSEQNLDAVQRSLEVTGQLLFPRRVLHLSSRAMRPGFAISESDCKISLKVKARPSL